MRLLVEGSHSYCFNNLLHQVVVLLDWGALLVAGVSNPNFSSLHLEVVLRLQDLTHMCVWVWNSGHFDWVKALSSNDKSVIIAVCDVKEVLTNADWATTLVIRDHFEHDWPIVVVEANSLIFDWGKEEVARCLWNTILSIDIAYRRKFFLAKTTVNDVLVRLIASR